MYKISLKTFVVKVEIDFSKHFIQGIILTAVSQPNESSLPKRYTQALSNLTPNPNIIISSTDKLRSVDKINSLLEDTNTYEISNLTTINKDIISFNKLVRNKKNWISLIEHYCTIQTLYAKARIYKPNTFDDPLSTALVVPPTN